MRARRLIGGRAIRHGLKVGITVPGGVSDVHAAVWSSGVLQNAVFLAMLMQRLPAVAEVAFVACPPGAGPCVLAPAFGFPAMEETDAVERLDVLIELGARGDAERMRRFRDRGGRLVSYVAGNVMALNFEALANGSPYGEQMSASGFDAVWVTPQHWRMNQSYLRLTRCPDVRQAPHIWSPACLMAGAAHLGVDIFYKAAGEPRRWRVGVLEPNVNALKTFHLPLLVCEEAYRRDPAVIDRVLLFNTAHLTAAPHFAELTSALDLARDGRLFAEARFPLPEVLGRHIDAVVAHQWENELNYLYWDVLYAGWPLVHNSAALGEAGYHYPDFDPQAGGEALVEALKTHGSNRGARRAAELDAIWLRHIDNPAVQSEYSDLLEAVTP